MKRKSQCLGSLSWYVNVKGGNMVNGPHLYSAFIQKRFTVLTDIHPFIHTHTPTAESPRRATARQEQSGWGVWRHVRCVSICIADRCWTTSAHSFRLVHSSRLCCCRSPCSSLSVRHQSTLTVALAATAHMRAEPERYGGNSDFKV